jgi:hypothetical protein
MPHDCMTPFWLWPTTDDTILSMLNGLNGTILGMSMTGLYTILILLLDYMIPFCITAWDHSYYAELLNNTILTMHHNSMKPIWQWPMTEWHHFGFATWLHGTIQTVIYDCMAPFWLCHMTAWHFSTILDNTIKMTIYAPWLRDTILTLPHDCMTPFWLCHMTAWNPSTILHDTILTMHHNCMTPFWLCPMTAWPQQMCPGWPQLKGFTVGNWT